MNRIIHRTRRLTTMRALELLKIKYGSDVGVVKREEKIYIASIGGTEKKFRREQLLHIERELYTCTGF